MGESNLDLALISLRSLYSSNSMLADQEPGNARFLPSLTFEI